MDRFAGLTGRSYHLFDYVGAPDAERVIVLMGSGAETAHETVDYLTARGEKVGVLKVRLYRPFSVEHFAAALPKTVKSIAVLDRTKEPGSAGEPLYLDVVNALAEAGRVARRSSAAATASPARSSRRPWSRPSSTNWRSRRPRTTSPSASTTTSPTPAWTTTRTSAPSRRTSYRALFYGLGSDGTVGANKNSIKIIGEDTDNYAQGYFVYDSKKAGVHDRQPPALRARSPSARPTWSTRPTSSPATCGRSWRGTRCWRRPCPGATFLLNAPFPAEEVWDRLPCETQERIIDMKLKVYAINAYEVAKETGMGGRINTIMQTCFFYLSNILPQDEAIAAIKRAIKKTYGKRGEKVVADELQRRRPGRRQSARDRGARGGHQHGARSRQLVPAEAPEFVKTRHRHDHGRRGRRAAGQPDAGRRRLAHRHHPVGEAQHRPRDPGVGAGALHPVRQVLVPLPARHHPHQGLRPGAPGRRPGDLQVGRRQGQGVRRQEVDRAGGAPRTAPAAAPASRSARARTRPTRAARPSTWPSSRRCASTERDNYAFFLEHPRPRPRPGAGEQRQGQPAAAAAVRVLRAPAPAAARRRT